MRIECLVNQSCCIAIVAVFLSMSGTQTMAQFGLMNASQATMKNVATESVLERYVSLDFKEVPAIDVLDLLGEKTGLNFILTESAINDLLTEDELITVRLKGVSLSKGIRVMLSKHNATYMIDEGLVMIISREDEENSDMLRVKTFDCREFVGQMPSLSPRALQPSHYYNGGGRGGHTIPKSKTQKPEARRYRTPEEVFRDKGVRLIQTISGTVAIDSWETSSAGGVCRMEFSNGILIVSQTEEFLQKVEQFLADMHAHAGLKLPYLLPPSNQQEPLVLELPLKK